MRKLANLCQPSMSSDSDGEEDGPAMLAALLRQRATPAPTWSQDQGRAWSQARVLTALGPELLREASITLLNANEP